MVNKSSLSNLKISTNYYLKEYIKLIINSIFHVINFFHRKYNKKGKIIYIGFFSLWFGGNIKAMLLSLKNWITKSNLDDKISIYFSSSNNDQVKLAKKQGIQAYHRHDLEAINVFSNTKIVITTHGERMLPFSRNEKFFDLIYDFLKKIIQKITPYPLEDKPKKRIIKRIELWHGVPFKDVNIDTHPANPDIFCVPSKFIKDEYSKKGYKEEIFRITGYPRNDILFETPNRKDILSSLKIPSDKKIILYAPTWQHVSEKKLFPWGNQMELIKSLCDFLSENNTYFLIRPHIMWKPSKKDGLQQLITECQNIMYAPMIKYPDIYPILSITDVLITDWSSISFDFMLLKKPIIFIECENPIGKFCFNPNERAGLIVTTPNELINSIKISLKDSSEFIKKYSPNFNDILDKAFFYKDGNASSRIIKIIEDQLKDIL
jgi:CDP-glycerol glycerophosphotransferase